MLRLYDSAFSPFARKVRMTLEYKGLDYEAVDGLLKSNHEALKAVNERVEVPALVDGDLVVVNSADIVAYLDYRYPAKRMYPNDPAARVHARAWERVADTFVDPILVRSEEHTSELQSLRHLVCRLLLEKKNGSS